MPRLSTFAALSLLVVGVSGCVGGGSAGTGQTATAMALRPDAGRLAGESADALMVVFSLETADPAPLSTRELPAWLAPFLVPDARLGDGRAAAWGFVYGGGGMPMNMGADEHSHGGAMDLIVIGADHQQRYRGDPGAAFPVVPAEEIGMNWSADSAAAAATAFADQGAALAHPDAYVWQTLSQRTGLAPAWLFEPGRTSTGDAPQAAVDARDGAKIKLGNRDPWAATPTELGTLQGHAQPGSAATGASFHITDLGHKQLEFILQVAPASNGGTQTGNEIDFTAKGPNGQSFPFHWDGSDGTEQSWWQWDAPLPGDWTIEARLSATTSATDFSIKWCAIGATRCLFE